MCTPLFPLHPTPTNSLGRTVQVASSALKLPAYLSEADDTFSLKLIQLGKGLSNAPVFGWLWSPMATVLFVLSPRRYSVLARSRGFIISPFSCWAWSLLKPPNDCICDTELSHTIHQLQRYWRASHRTSGGNDRYRGKEKLLSVKQGRTLFLHLYISCAKCVRTISILDDFFRHENQPYPPAISENGDILLSEEDPTLTPVREQQQILWILIVEIHFLSYGGRFVAYLKVNSMIRQRLKTVLSMTPMDMSHLTHCSHEEADTRMLLHAADGAAKECKKILTLPVDTDIMILTTVPHNYLLGCENLWIALGTEKTHNACNELHITTRKAVNHAGMKWTLPISSKTVGCTYKNLNRFKIFVLVEGVKSEEFWAALSIEPMRVKRGECGATPECKSGGKQEIPEETRRPAASSGTILTCEKSRRGPARSRTRLALMEVLFLRPMVQRATCSMVLLKAVHDEVSTLEMNLRKKSQPLHAYILLEALSGIRPVELDSGSIDTIPAAQLVGIEPKTNPLPPPRRQYTAQLHMSSFPTGNCSCQDFLCRGTLPGTKRLLHWRGDRAYCSRELVQPRVTPGTQVRESRVRLTSPDSAASVQTSSRLSMCPAASYKPLPDIAMNSVVTHARQLPGRETALKCLNDQAKSRGGCMLRMLTISLVFKVRGMKQLSRRPAVMTWRFCPFIVSAQD
ncbi:hypothetical protein PR048_016910 [Dryococelus australis]|uniref:Uncharacterized protein n=1 Tax=Dryococelus australis TaxID=614101 RepID=A0ABQ9H808_9NEOP|nr:hypothetical protein PR048_016910 [Dryococelus australis]